MTKQKKKVDWEKKYKAEVKKHKVEVKKYKKELIRVRFSKDASYDAFELRKKGMTWKKIAKKLDAPESTVRLATQRRFKHPILKGRWSKDKLDVSRVIDSRTRAMLADRERNPLRKSYEEYIRQKY